MFDPRLTVTDTEYVMNFHPVAPDAITLSISAPLLHLQTVTIDFRCQMIDGHMTIASFSLSRDIDRTSMMACLGMLWSTSDTIAAHCPIFKLWPHPLCTIVMQSPMQSLSHDPYELLRHDEQAADPIRSPHLIRDITSLRIHRKFLVPPKPPVAHAIASLDWYHYRAHVSFHELTGRQVDDYGVHYSQYLWTIRSQIHGFLVAQLPHPHVYWANIQAIQEWAIRHDLSITRPETWERAISAIDQRPGYLLEVERSNASHDEPTEAWIVPLSHDPSIGLIDAISVTLVDQSGIPIYRWIAWMNPLHVATLALPPIHKRLLHELALVAPSVPIHYGPVTPFIACAPSCPGLRIPHGTPMSFSCTHAMSSEIMQVSLPGVSWHNPLHDQEPPPQSRSVRSRRRKQGRWKRV